MTDSVSSPKFEVRSWPMDSSRPYTVAGQCDDFDVALTLARDTSLNRAIRQTMVLCDELQLAAFWCLWALDD